MSTESPLPSASSERTPEEHFNELREWVREHCFDPHPVRHSAYALALTANIHRLIKYGPDACLDHLTARDLMNLLIYTNGEIAEWLMRAAFVRSIIENDEEITLRLANSPFIKECTMWYWRLIEGITGNAVDPKATTEWLESLPKEEQSVARLMIVRVFPDTAHVDWLNDVPDTNPSLQYALALIIAQKPEYRHACENFLRQRPAANAYQFN